MYRGKASSCLLLSVPPRRWLIFGVPAGWGGTAGGVGVLTLESFAGSRCGGSHRLTHLRLSLEIAARQLAPLRVCYHRPPEERSSRPLASPTPGGGFGARTAPGDSPSSTCAPAAAAVPAPTASTHAQPAPRTPVTSPGTRPSPHCRPQARVDTGQARAAHRGCHRGQEWGWQGTGARVPCGAPSPAPARPSLDPLHQARAGGGGDKDTVPLRIPTAEEAGLGVPQQVRGQQALPILPPAQ